MAGTPKRVSDAAVKKATGKTWLAWFKILDKFPQDKSHTERAVWLWKNHLKKAWWSQMVTVTYEQARGLRAKHETDQGFQVSGSRTVPISVSQLYRWWTTKRSSWLKLKDVVVTSATTDKYLHMTWPDGSKVDVNFWKKSPTRSMVQVQQSKLKNALAAKRAKTWWSKTLDQFTDSASSAVDRPSSSKKKKRRA